MPRLAYKSAIWAIAHRLCRVVWKILHEGGAIYRARPRSGSPEKKQRAQMPARALRKLGYEVTITPINQLAPKPAIWSGEGFSTERNCDITTVDQSNALRPLLDRNTL
jgi:hypothetical protein